MTQLPPCLHAGTGWRRTEEAWASDLRCIAITPFTVPKYGNEHEENFIDGCPATLVAGRAHVNNLRRACAATTCDAIAMQVASQEDFSFAD